MTGLLARRGAAYLVDCALAFVAFAASQALLLAPLRGAAGLDASWFHSGINTQAYVLLTVSVPVWLYFALLESSRWQATPGKRLLGLRVGVAGAGGRRAGLGSTFLRTLGKLLPWEVAHLANNLPTPMWFAEDPGLRAGFLVSGVLFAVIVGSVLAGRGRQGLHDVLAGTEVLRATG